jgi:opacity protein-like surface antigen
MKTLLIMSLMIMSVSCAAPEVVNLKHTLAIDHSLATLQTTTGADAFGESEGWSDKQFVKGISYEVRDEESPIAATFGVYRTDVRVENVEGNMTDLRVGLRYYFDEAYTFYLGSSLNKGMNFNVEDVFFKSQGFGYSVESGKKFNLTDNLELTAYVRYSDMPNAESKDLWTDGYSVSAIELDSASTTAGVMLGWSF